MACACEKTKQEGPSAQADGLEFCFCESATPFVGSDGKVVRLTSPVVRAPFQPRGGWKVSWMIKGQQVNVQGDSSQSVFKSSKAILEQNQVPFTEQDLWLNLNIQWAKRTVEKYLQIPLVHLLSMADVRDLPEQGPHERKRWDAAEWLTLAWNSPLLYLSGTNYRFSDLVGILDQILVNLDTSLNPVLGNAKAHASFVVALADFKKNPAFVQNEAKIRLVEMINSVMTSVSAPTVSFDDISTKYHW